MNSGKDHIQDIREIRKLMKRSTRFLSLSGLSGIFAGIVALIGAAVAYYILDYTRIIYDGYFYFLNVGEDIKIMFRLIVLGVIILVLALGSGFYFSWRRSRKQGVTFWGNLAKRVLIQLMIPLVTGGIVALVLISRNEISLLAGITLIFYGLALVNASKYTLAEINYLGLSEIILGILALIFINYGLLFWAAGFGLLHIIYGVIMYYKYEHGQ